MALTTTQKTEAYQFFIVAFGAATGVEYMNQLNDAYNAGMTTKQIVNVYTTKPQFEAQYPRFLTNEQFADKLIENVVGASATAAAKTEAKADVAAALNAGWTKGDVVFQIFTNLAAKAPTDAQWGNTSLMLANKVAVAQYVTETLLVNTTDLAKLGSYIASVTEVAATVDAAKLAAQGANGQTFTLTVDQNNFTGTTGNDTFNAGAAQDGAGKLINTLQNVDVLDGGAGTDTLKATLAQAAAVAPTLKNIENVEVRFADAGASLDLANATGVQSVVVADSTTAGLVSSVGAVASLTVRNQNQNASFTGSTAATLGLTLDTVGSAAGGNKTVDLGQAAAAKATTLNVTANNAYVTVDSTKADVATTLTVAATGTNVLTFTDSAATAKAVTVTGAGSVNLMGAAFTAALTSFDASANTGGVKADIQSTATAAVKGGSGNDVFDMDTAVAANTTVDLGAGNDAIYVGAKLASFKSIAGGEGTDIINITDAATWTAANSKIISGFETLDVSGGKGDYDVSLGGFTTVQIDEAINGVLTGATKAINAGADFTLNVMSKAKTNADFALGQTTAIVLKDATGKADSVNINVTINDGNNDAAADGNVVFTTSTTIAGVENVNIKSSVATLDTGVKANAYSTTFADLIVADVTTLTLTGDSDIIFTALTNANNTLTKVNASGSTGDITLNASAIATQIAYQGSAGVDTYTATKGGSIYGAAGNDQITLAAAGAGGKADTLIYKAASDVTFADANADGKIDAAGGIETINNFITAAAAVAGGEEADVLDLTSFGFAGYAKSAVNKGVLAAAVESGNFQMQIANFFADAAGNRAVAFGTVGANTYVFVDANSDGNWNAASDLAIKLVGVNDFAVTAIAF